MAWKTRQKHKLHSDLDKLRAAGHPFTGTQVFYVDPSNYFDSKPSNSFATMTAAITHANNNSGKGFIYLVAPGYYIELDGLTLSASDVAFIAANPTIDATVFFGSGTAGAVAAGDEDLLTITGSNTYFYGMGFYEHKNTKSAIVLSNCNYNYFSHCNFSRQAADGMLYGIDNVGAAYMRVYDCTFTAACKDAGIYFQGGTNNPAYWDVEGCKFVGCNIGLKQAAGISNYGCMVRDTTFVSDSQSGGTLTYAVNPALGCTGEIMLDNCSCNLSNANAWKDDSGNAIIKEINVNDEG